MTNGVYMGCCNQKYVKKALDLSRELIILADQGELKCSDNSPCVLFGILRDCAYKIKARAEEEKDKLKVAAKWNDTDDKNGT